LSCAICGIRKEKRFCPAVHGRICAQCCGEQREVTLDCPSECPYLKQARQHEKPRDLAKLDREALFPEVEIGQEFLREQEHLILGLGFALARSARANRILEDRDLTAALTSLSRSYETLVRSGLIYEQPYTNRAQQAIAAEVESMIREYREAEQKHTGAVRLRDPEVLKALVFLLRMGLGRTSGRPKSRAFVDFLFARFPEQQSAVTAAKEAGSRIILP
jgi:hypothetical protein